MSILTAVDVEAAGAGGRLILGVGDRLTPLARDRAKELGIEIVTGNGLAVAPATAAGLATATAAATATVPATVAATVTTVRPVASRPASSPGSPFPRAPVVPAPTRPVPAGFSAAPAAGAATAATTATTATTATAATAATTASGRPLLLPPSGALYRRHALGPGGTGGAAGAGSIGGAGGVGTSRPRAAVVGAGHVGAMAALRLAESDLFQSIALVDVVSGLAAGLALDMWHGAGLYGFSSPLQGSDDLAALAGADYIIITAGRPRQPGMTRTDLTAVNAAIMASVCEGVRRYAPEATVVVVSNPLEEMTHLAARFTGFPQARVLGMAGVLDSARFCSLVGLTGKAKPAEVRALALGSHGPEMVIPLSQAFVGDLPIEQLIDGQTLAAIIERTRESGGEVVKLLQKGSAYFSPAESAAAMVRAMATGSGEVLAACVRSGGAYGTVDTRVGLPVRLGRRGLEEIVALALRPAEQQALAEAAARIAQRITEVEQLVDQPPARAGGAAPTAAAAA